MEKWHGRLVRIKGKFGVHVFLIYSIWICSCLFQKHVGVALPICLQDFASLLYSDCTSLPDSHVSYWSTELSDSTWPFHAHRQHLIQKTSAVRAQGNLRRRHFPWARTRGVESSKHSIQKHLASWMSAIALWRYQNVAQLFKNRYCTTNTAIHTSSSKAKVPWAQYGYDRLCLEG